MLILGEKYKFTDLELKRLNKKFDIIETLIYKDKAPVDVISDIENELNSNSVKVIVLNTKVKVDDEIIKYLTNLKYSDVYNKVKIISIEHFLEQYLFKCYIPESNDDLHYLDDIKEFNIWQRFQKKIVDIIAMIGLFLIWLLATPFVKKKIKEQSPGSVYYKQLRVGLGNIEFECNKFRTMSEDAEKDGIQFSSKDDPRKFPFGDIMRDTRLDEIPQALNILKGEMSLIGPRPERKYWIKKDFESAIPYYNQRHVIKPGITGWAQVMYPYGANVEDARQKLMYDLYYIKHWSLWLEIKTIFKTIGVVFGRKGV
jgi:lipopolysaccharide/colanic/teichoic acid biosynthesis glycosyltransferase